MAFNKFHFETMRMRQRLEKICAPTLFQRDSTVFYGLRVACDQFFPTRGSFGKSALETHMNSAA